MNAKKLISMILLVNIMMVSISGCSSASGGKENESDVTDVADVADQTNEKPVLKYLGCNVTFDLPNSPMISIIENVTGYKMEYEALPEGDEGTTKLLLLISSGTPYDIINQYTNNFDRLLAANAARPVDDLIKNAPNLREAVPEDSNSWQRVRGKDGKHYGIPQLSPIKQAVSTIAVRKDIMEDLDIQMPATPDEFYNTLKIIKNERPEMIPLTIDKAFSAPPIQSGFNVYKDWYEVDGKLICNQQRPEYKQYIDFMRKLYSERLLDNEFPANDTSKRLSLFTSGKAAMTFFGYGDGPGFYSALDKSVSGAEVDYIPFLESENGNKGAMASGGLEKVCVIPKAAAHPDDAMAWIDAFMANFKQLYIGEEDVDHKVEDGKYIPIMPNFAVHDTMWWFMPAIDEAHCFDWWQARVRKNEEVERGYMDTFALKTSDANIVTPFFEMVPLDEEFIKLGNTLDQYWNDEMIKIIAGASPMENYDRVVEKWESDGGIEYVRLANDMWKENRQG